MACALGLCGSASFREEVFSIRKPLVDSSRIPAGGPEVGQDHVLQVGIQPDRPRPGARPRGRHAGRLPSSLPLEYCFVLGRGHNLKVTLRHLLRNVRRGVFLLIAVCEELEFRRAVFVLRLNHAFVPCAVVFEILFHLRTDNELQHVLVLRPPPDRPFAFTI